MGSVEEKPETKRWKTEAQSKQKKKKKKCKLLRYEELPEYMKENQFIRNYYRAEWPIKNALLSLFSWHNETLNIWTHLLGFIVFLGLSSMHLSYHVPQVAEFLGHLTWPISTSAVENVSCSLGNFFGEAAAFIKLAASSETTAAVSSSVEAAARWPFFVFLGGSMFCLLSSSTCHLLCCHSHRLNIFLLRMDYVGIAVMIVTSFFPPIYYIFQCDPHWQLTYLVAISAMGFVTVFTLLAPHLSTGEFRTYRALLFVGMGCFGVVPALHAAVVNWDDPRRNATLAYEAAMAVSYLTGTLFYVTRVPERWKPGWFDLAGHSHQIFHVFVLAGAMAHYGAALIFLRRRDELGCGGAGLQ
ncbi:heptahelical transmembrane protein ADIPOR1-like [Canna indica]|uniref:Heptahelical transmembrane protein ADIPOR1-like n=1 Tax=Canna indica TaxID=4628 RepID=A0AAQ3Q5V3_9LILI|nr:heptahelical transmembrane protein ADIPOR1-like [Canna indica]